MTCLLRRKGHAYIHYLFFIHIEVREEMDLVIIVLLIHERRVASTPVDFVNSKISASLLR